MLAGSDFLTNVVSVVHAGLSAGKFEIGLHSSDQSPFIAFGRTSPLPGHSISQVGKSEAEVGCTVHAAEAQSDGLAKGLHKVFHGFISFTLFHRHRGGVGVFYISLSTDLQPDQTSHWAMHRRCDRWGE